jgi:hypothetical protein
MRTGLIVSLALVATMSLAASGGRSLAAESGLTFAKCDCSDPDCKCSPKTIKKSKENAERAAAKRAKQEKAAPQKPD